MKYDIEISENKASINVDIPPEELKLPKEELEFIRDEARLCYDKYLENHNKEYQMKLNSENAQYQMKLNSENEQCKIVVSGINGAIIQLVNLIKDMTSK